MAQILDGDGAEWKIRRYREDQNSNDHMLVNYPLSDGGRSTLQLPMSHVARPQTVVDALLTNGAALPPYPKDQLALVRSLISSIPPQAGVLATSIGWHGNSFLLGRRRLGKDDVVLRESCRRRAATIGSTEGTLQGWIDQIAMPAADSSYVSFAIMASLGAPLRRFTKLVQEGAIFHFAGKSSIGKTSAIRAAASVWGKPVPLNDWNATSRGLDELAAARSDVLLSLDDTERMRGKDPLSTLAHAAHVLTGGKSSEYAEGVSHSHHPLVWRCFALSSGPYCVDDEYKKRGHQRTQGDQVRFIDLPIHDAEIFGIWDLGKETNAKSRALLSERLNESSEQQFGHAGITWIKYLVENISMLDTKVPQLVERFLSKLPASGGKGAERRIATKFALAYAGGKLAMERGLLPWAKGFPLEVCRRLCLRSLRYAEEANAYSSEKRSVAKLLTIARDHSTCPRFDFGHTPEFKKGSRADIFIRRRKGAPTILYVKRELLAEMTNQEDGALISFLQKEGVLIGGQGQRNGRQIRVRVGASERKVRFLGLSLIKLKRCR